MADSQPPKPVAPAESIPHEPAEALEGLTNKEPGMLDKAKETVMPYLTQAQQASKPYLDKAKPYTDAAIAKGHQLVEKLDAAAGLPPAQPTSTPGVASSTTETSAATRDLGTAASTTTAGLGASAEAAGVPATAGEAGEKVKGVFDQISSTVTSTFNSVTNTINEKTASGDKPGILTQVSQFAERSLDKVDHFLSAEEPAKHPVQTTTNSVPHHAAGLQGPAEPVVQAASTPAVTTLPIGVTPTPAGTIPGANR